MLEGPEILWAWGLRLLGLTMGSMRATWIWEQDMRKYAVLVCARTPSTSTALDRYLLHMVVVVIWKMSEYLLSGKKSV